VSGDHLLPAEGNGRPNGGLSPLGGFGDGSEADSVALLAAALRADAVDLDTYERILADSIADSLPAGMLEIERVRSLSDRVANRPGKVVAIRVHLGELNLELTTRHSSLVGSVGRTVRGVAISNKEVPLEEWTRLFAEQLANVAAANAAARAALGRLLGAGG